MTRLLTLFGTLTVLMAATGTARAQNRTVDLRNTNVARNIKATLHEIAQGNERSSGIDSLTFDGNSGAVAGKVWVRHRQVAGYTPKIFNPFSGRREGGDPIVVYDLTQSAEFRFNLTNDSGHVNLDLGRGVRLDTRRIERILQGDIGAVVEMVPSGGIVTRKFHNEYERISQSYYDRYGGRAKVYFASPRFVSWATPETAGKWVLTGIASGGSAAVAQAMREVKQKALEELRPLSRWLQANGIREAESMARTLLSGGRAEWPDVTVKWQTVGYFSRNYLAGRPVGPEIRVTHAAFVVLWRQGPRPSGGSTPVNGQPLGTTAPGIPTNTPAALAVNRSIGGNLAAGRRDRYHVALQAGQSYTLTADRTSGNLDPIVRVRSGGGQLLGEDDDGGGERNARLVFRPNAGGLYTIEVASYGSSSGGYRLLVHPNGSVPAAGNPGRPTGGPFAPQFGNLAANGVARYRVNLQAGRTYVITANHTGGTLDPMVRVRAGNGQVLGQDDDSGGNRNARLVFRPAVSGAYTVEVSSYGTTSGRFRLAIQD